MFEALDRAAARGLQMVFVPGNHDFRLGPVMANRYNCEVRGPHTREIDGVRIHVSHGDESDSGIGYRLLGGFLRGRIAGGLMRLIGVRMGTAVLRWLAGEPAPVQSDVWPNTLQTLRANLADSEVAIMGHAHVPWRHEEPHGLGVILGPGVSGAVWVEDGLLRTPAD